MLQDLGGGRWKVRVSFGRDEHGTQVRRAKTFKADGIRKARVLAHGVETQIRADYEREQERPPDTFARATEQWWELWRRRDRSPSTRQGYRSMIDNHILRSPLASKPVTALRVGDFDRWYADLGDRVGATTVHRIHAIVVQVLDQCLRDGAIASNPAKMARKPSARPARRPHTSADAVRAILDAAWERSPVHARALKFAALTGLRRGELIGLRWSRIDLELGVAVVELNTIAVGREFVDDEASIRGGKGGMVMVDKDPKSHQVAAIALGDQAAQLVADQMAWQRSEAAYTMVDMAADPVLWQPRAPFAAPMWPDTLSHWMARARRDAGQPKVRLHDLRHFQASSILEVGGTVADVQERLRHRSIQTSFGYLEADRSKQRALVDLLPQLDLPAHVDRVRG